MYDPAIYNMSINRDIVIDDGSSWDLQSWSSSSKSRVSSLLNDNGDSDESFEKDMEVPTVKVNYKPKRTKNITRRLQECEFNIDNE